MKIRRAFFKTKHQLPKSPFTDRAEAAHRQRHRERDIRGRQPQGVLPLQARLHQVQLHPRLRRRRILPGKVYIRYTVTALSKQKSVTVSDCHSIR